MFQIRPAVCSFVIDGFATKTGPNPCGTQRSQSRHLCSIEPPSLLFKESGFIRNYWPFSLFSSHRALLTLSYSLSSLISTPQPRPFWLGSVIFR